MHLVERDHMYSLQKEIRVMLRVLVNQIPVNLSPGVNLGPPGRTGQARIPTPEVQPLEEAVIGGVLLREFCQRGRGGGKKGRMKDRGGAEAGAARSPLEPTLDRSEWHRAQLCLVTDGVWRQDRRTLSFLPCGEISAAQSAAAGGDAGGQVTNSGRWRDSCVWSQL